MILTMRRFFFAHPKTPVIPYDIPLSSQGPAKGASTRNPEGVNMPQFFHHTPAGFDFCLAIMQNENRTALARVCPCKTDVA